MSRFVPKNKVLFNLVDPKSGTTQAFSSSADPLFSGPVAVLVSHDNTGTAEAIAGVLRNQLHALVIGQQIEAPLERCSKVLVPRFIKAIKKEFKSIDGILEIIGAELGRRSLNRPPSEYPEGHEKP